MATAKDIPELVSEFNDLAKQYVKEQTIEPAKALGRVAGLSAAAAIIFVLASIFLSVLVLRVIVDAMPDGSIWSGFGYILASVAVMAGAGLVIWRASK